MESGLGPRNRRVVAAARLHRRSHREETGRTLIEGPHLLADSLAAGWRPETVFARSDDEETSRLASVHGLELVPVSPAALDRLSGTRSPRGPVAVVTLPDMAPVAATPRSLLVAWGISDPGNLGTLARIAAGFAWDLGYTPGTADPWSPKTLRAGAGAHFRIGVFPVAGIGRLRELGLRTVASVVRGGSPPETVGPGPFALLVGEEGAGLPAELVAAADVTTTIPMPGGTESLNVAAAAAILVYQLGKAGGHPATRV